MKLVRESLNEQAFGQEEVSLWAEQMMNLLEKHKITQFGGELPIEDVQLIFLEDGAADVEGKVKVGNVQFNLYFNIRDQRRWNDPSPKWVSEVSISSPQKKGYFTKQASGKNTSPAKLIQLLSDMLNLKFKR